MPKLRSLLVDRRRQALLAAAVVTGIVTGALVAGFEVITSGVMLDNLFRAPLWVQAVVPSMGLLVAALALRWVGGGADATTADAYVANFHERGKPLPQRPVVGRILASIATLGSGGSMGFEGPSIYIGAAIGSGIQHRFRRWFRSEDAKALLVAGAAGGVAAIFKAPATGVLFALEVPYQDDIARSGLIPSLVAAAASYLTFVSILGTKPLLDLTTGRLGFGGIELLGAGLVGLSAGFAARLFCWVMRVAKDIAHRWPVWRRILVFGGGIVALTLVSHHLFGDTLNLGPGYRTFDWMASPDRAIVLILALFVIRLAATAMTVGGGGAGGMFIPLVIEGAVLGRLVAGIMDGLHLNPTGHPFVDTSLFPILGIAAFLGAGYRTPLAGVMFVAESTGKAVFVVPGLIAAAVSQLLMARSSVSLAQRGHRLGHLETRFALPISAALLSDVLTVPADATVAEFVSDHVVHNRQRAAVVLDDDGRYAGLCVLRDVAEHPRDQWDHLRVTDVMRVGLPTASVTWQLRDALQAMEDADVDRLAVLDRSGAFVGEIRRSEIFKLEELLSDTGG